MNVEDRLKENRKEILASELHFLREEYLFQETTILLSGRDFDRDLDHGFDNMYGRSSPIMFVMQDILRRTWFGIQGGLYGERVPEEDQDR